MKTNVWKRPLIVACVCLQGFACALSAQLIDATYIGSGTLGLSTDTYDRSSSWDIGVVPFDGGTSQYHAIMDNDQFVDFSASSLTIGAVSELTVGDDTTLKLLTGNHFTILSNQTLSGVIESSGTSAFFDSVTTNGSIDGSRLRVIGGSGIRTAVDAYFNNRTVEETVFLSDGAGGLLDLSSLQILEIADSPFSSLRNKEIVSRNDGEIDLSGVFNLIGPEGSTLADRLTVVVESGGDIDLSSVTQVTGKVTFDVDVPAYELPLLETADGNTVGALTFDVGPGNALNLPALTVMHEASLLIGNGAVLSASNLTEFTSSVLDLVPGQTLNAPPFTNIDGSQLSVSGGAGFAAGAISYENDSAVAATIFSASGPGSDLDLVTMTDLNVSDSPIASRRDKRIEALDQGVIDLSGLERLAGSSKSSTLADRLTVQVGTNSTIDLSSVTQVLGKVTFDVDSALYDLPLLSVADGNAYGTLTFDVGTGSTLNLPLLPALNQGSLLFEPGGLLNATNLTTFTSSILALDSNETLNAPQFTNIDASQFNITTGAIFSVAASSYANSETIAATILSADGLSAMLDLSSLQSMTISDSPFASSRNKVIEAKGGGFIDLSLLNRLEGPEGSVLADELAIRVSSQGDVDFSSLTQVTGHVVFDIDVTDYSLPLLAVVDGHAVGSLVLDVGSNSTVNLPLLPAIHQGTIVLGDGATLNAGGLLSFTESVMILGSNQTLNAPLFVNIDGSQLGVTGGASFDIAATSYSNVTSVAATIFSADGSNSLLDLSSLQFLSVPDSPGATEQHKEIVAANSGLIDLSGVTHLAGSDGTSLSDRLTIRVQSGADVDFSALQQVTGKVTFDIDVPSYGLPVLSIADGNFVGGLLFDIGPGSEMDLPVLPALHRGTISIADGGVLNAPNLLSFTESVLTLGSNQVLNAPPFTQIDGSQLGVTSGASLAVAALAYSNRTDVSATIFSADGANSVLDLSTLQSLRVDDSPIASSRDKFIRASNGGRINLVGLGPILSPSAGILADTLFVQVESGGEVALGDAAFSGLTETSITGSGSVIRALSLSISEPSTLSVFDSALVMITNELTTGAGVTTRVDGASINIGTNGTDSTPGRIRLHPNGFLGSSGTFEGDVMNEGIVSPGLSAGVLTADGDYNQMSNGTLFIEVGGEIPDTEHDQLAVSGSADLDGAFELDLINGFFPGLNDEFIVLTAASVSGEFTETNSAVLGVDCVADLIYSNDAVILLLSSGDLDGDGLPSCWENAYGFDPEDDGSVDINNGPDGDPDGDFQGNLDELISGTIPIDPASVFRFSFVEPGTGSPNVEITITTEPRREYAMEYTDEVDATNVFWTPFLNTTDGIGTWIETGEVSSTYLFTDDFTTNTSGSASSGGERTYRCLVNEVE
jgi:hypothetical protein